MTSQRIKTRIGIVDVYQDSGTNQFQLATLKRDGMGYRQVTRHKRILEAGKTIGESITDNKTKIHGEIDI